MVISQTKVPPQHIYLLSLHPINPLNKWKWATTRCHHIYLQACLKVHTPKCCYSKSGWTVEILMGLFDSSDVFFSMLDVCFSMMRMENTAQVSLCCWILWYIKAGLEDFFVVLYKGIFCKRHVGKIWFTGSMILNFSLAPPCRRWARFIRIHLSDRFWSLTWSQVNALSSQANQNSVLRSF